MGCGFRYAISLHYIYDIKQDINTTFNSIPARIASCNAVMKGMYRSAEDEDDDLDLAARRLGGVSLLGGG